MRLSAHVLSPKSLYKLAEDLRDYADSIPQKVEQFLNELADLGIEVARQNGGDYAGYIVYSKEFESEGDEFVMRIVARDSQSITNTWYSSDSDKAEIRSDTFSPLLMAEFGSGAYQQDDMGIGRLPDSYGHGGDANGWYWWSDRYTDGEIKKVGKTGRMLFHSYGTPPTRPMHQAAMTMIAQVESIARSVFG